MSQTDVIVTKVEVVDNSHQTVLDRNVVGSIDDEPAHRFRFLFVQPADSSGELRQPEKRVAAGVHSNRCPKMRTKNRPVLTVDFDALDTPTKRIAEVKVFAVERHRRNRSVDLNLFLVAIVQVPYTDVVMILRSAFKYFEMTDERSILAVGSVHNCTLT